MPRRLHHRKDLQHNDIVTSKSRFGSHFTRTNLEFVHDSPNFYIPQGKDHLPLTLFKVGLNLAIHCQNGTKGTLLLGARTFVKIMDRIDFVLRYYHYGLEEFFTDNLNSFNTSFIDFQTDPTTHDTKNPKMGHFI